MGIETVDGIWDLNELWPLESDAASGSDDHHRVVKEALEETFPYISANIATTSESFNFLKGIESNVQAQLDNISGSVSIAIAELAKNEASLVSQQTELNTQDTDITTLQTKAGNIYKTYIGLVSASGTPTYLPGGFTVTGVAPASGRIEITHFPTVSAADRSSAIYMVTAAEPGYSVGIAKTVLGFAVTSRVVPGGAFGLCDFYFQVLKR